MHRIVSALSALVLVLSTLLLQPAFADEDPPVGDWDPTVAEAAAERVLGSALAGQVDFLSMAPAASGVDAYRVWDRDGRIAVAGTSPAVALRGLNDYLGEYVNMSVSWNGDQVRTDETLPLPEAPITRTHRCPTGSP